MYDVIIIGKGPAGISASLYTSRAQLSTLIVGGNSNLAKSLKVDNYYGFPGGISGDKLLELGEEQAKELGVTIIDDLVLSIGFENGLFSVITRNKEFETKALLIATGQETNKVKIENIENFEGKGIHYCVVCDGFFYRDKKVGILGYTDYAVHEALELYNFSKDVTIYTNGKELQISDLSKDEIAKNNIKINKNEIEKFEGENNLERIVFANSEEETEGIFVAYGYASSSDFAKKLGILSNKGLISVDKDHKTNVPGIFAAGDCTSEFKQISVVVGQGAIAGHKIIEYLRSLGK